MDNDPQTAASMPIGAMDTRTAAGIPIVAINTQTAAGMPIVAMDTQTAAGMPILAMDTQTAAEMQLAGAPNVQKSVIAKKEVPDGHWTMALCFSVLAITIGSSFQFGYHIGCMNMIEDLIKLWINNGKGCKNETEWYPGPEDDAGLTAHEKEIRDRVNGQFGMATSAFAVGGMITGLSGGMVADMFGRKMTLLCNNAIAVIAAALMFSSKFFVPRSGYWVLVTGRFVVGLNSGFNSGIAPMYLMEISPANLRGTIGSCAQLFLTVAILTSQFIGMPFILGQPQSWNYVFACAVVPVIIQLGTLPFCPESPKFNLLIRNRKQQAEEDLKKLRQEYDVSAELDQINEDAIAARSQPKVTVCDMFGASLRWPLTIAVFMMVSQQLSGINAVMFYSTKLFKQARLEKFESQYATLAMGITNVLMTIVSVYLVDHPRFGRRSLHIAGMMGMAVTSALVVGTIFVAQSVQWVSYLSIVFVVIFVISFATGPGSIPWFYVNEVFPSNSRSYASSMVVLTNWLFTFLVGILFPILGTVLKNYTFLIFTGFLLIFILFAWKFLPETKNKTPEQIMNEMNGTSVDAASEEEKTSQV